MFPGDYIPGKRDEQIIEGFLKGKPDEVGIVSGWARSVVEYRSWNFDNREDIVQAVLLALLENIRSGKFSGGNLRAYVRTIAKNKCVSGFRRRKTRGIRIPLDENEYLYYERSFEEDVENISMAARILERLQDGCRQIIMLAYIEGYSRRRISEILGISEGAARVRLYRCVENARALFAGPSGGKEGA